MNTKHCCIFTINRQIFNLSNVAKKFIQFILYCSFFFMGCVANAASSPDFNLGTKLDPTLASLATFVPSMRNYENLSVYPNDLESTNLSWSRQVGASIGTTIGYGISTDGSGNSYVTGYTNKGISGQKQNGIQDYFIAKYDVSGNLIWSKQVGTSGGTTYGQGISTDSSGNSYVTGYTDKGISGQAQNGYYDYFIAKYDTNGNLIWSRQVGGLYPTGKVGKTEGNAISADKTGNIYVTGYTTVGISGQIQNGSWDYFIAKYDANGNLQWTRQVGVSGGFTEGNGISADNAGKIYVTGHTRGSNGISGQTQIGDEDYFIAKYDTFGNLIWTRQVGGTNNVGKYQWTYGQGISADSSGDIYVTGYTNVEIAGSQPIVEDYHSFIAKYDTNGNLIWTALTGLYGYNTYGYGVSADNLGNIYITGSLEAISLYTRAAYYISQYDKNGNLVWTTSVGILTGANTGITKGYGIVADNFGNIYVTGSTTVGISGQKKIGYNDYFIAKYVNSLISLWQ